MQMEVRMSVGDFLANIIVILAVLGVGALLEIAVPMFAAKAWRRDRRANLGLTAVTFLSNWALDSMAAAIARSTSDRPDGAARMAVVDRDRRRHRDP
jgi:hypothetical protein